MKEWLFGKRTVAEHLKVLPETCLKLLIIEGQKPDPELLPLISALSLPVETANRQRLEQLAQGGNHQGVLLQVSGFSYVEEEDLLERCGRKGVTPVIFALDCVQDTRNLGAVLRVADGMGAAGVVIPKDRSAQLTAAAARSAAGAAASVPVARVTNLARTLDSFKKEGFTLIGADHGAEENIYGASVRFPAVIVMGGEGKGIRPNVAGRLDVRAKLPMLGAVSSLNIAVAAGIFGYELLRRWQGAGK